MVCGEGGELCGRSLRNYVCVLVDVCSTCPAKMPLRPMMTRMLKTAEPTMVPTPTSPLVMKTPVGEWKRRTLIQRNSMEMMKLNGG